MTDSTVAVIGAGPAGLMAAEVLATAGCTVEVHEAMPSPARKLLRAGVGGLNLTHGEPPAQFLSRYGDRQPEIAPLLAGFDAAALRAWVHGLGIDTFVGSSGRVFPVGMKAAPLLRAWLQRLHGLGVRLHLRHRWLGWSGDGALRIRTADGGEQCLRPAATVLALGGASWPRLGADGAWAQWLAARGIALAPFAPANCGFDVAWSETFRTRFAGAPLKTVELQYIDAAGHRWQRRGDAVITAHGIEGGLIYALSAPLRDGLANGGRAVPTLDLLPDRSLDKVTAALAKPRGRRTHAAHWQRALGLEGVRAGLLRERMTPELLDDAPALARRIKALPLPLVAPRPLAEAISTAGGVCFGALDEQLMLRALPGTFCAGEMLDWEAPTGGYLLTACLASGRAAGLGVLAWLQQTGRRKDAPA